MVLLTTIPAPRLPRVMQRDPLLPPTPNGPPAWPEIDLDVRDVPVLRLPPRLVICGFVENQVPGFHLRFVDGVVAERELVRLIPPAQLPPEFLFQIGGHLTEEPAAVQIQSPLSVLGVLVLRIVSGMMSMSWWDHSHLMSWWDWDLNLLNRILKTKRTFRSAHDDHLLAMDDDENVNNNKQKLCLRENELLLPLRVRYTDVALQPLDPFLPQRVLLRLTPFGSLLAGASLASGGGTSNHIVNELCCWSWSVRRRTRFNRQREMHSRK